MRTIILVIFAICMTGTWIGCEKEEIVAGPTYDLEACFKIVGVWDIFNDDTHQVLHLINGGRVTVNKGEYKRGQKYCL